MMKKMKVNPNIWKYAKWPVLGLCLLLVLYAFFFLLPQTFPFFREQVFKVEGDTPLSDYGQMGDSFGMFNALFSGLAFFGVIITLILQSRDSRKRTIEEQFYKMLDVQQKVIDEINVAQIRLPKPGEELTVYQGRKAFVEYKIQMKYLVKAIRKVNTSGGFELSDIDIADIAYSVFFYGSSPTWKFFMMEYLKDYDDTERLVDAIIAKLQTEKKYALSRTNQNYLSVYFRNMYNAIKLIDGSSLFSEKEKKDHIKVLRAQLSNAELYILFFNIISRFGKKWIDNNYVTKYQLLQNIPAKYCDGYDPKEFFPKLNFESEERCLSPFKEMVVQRGE